MPTVAIEHHEFNVERYVGQTVRICGRMVQLESRWAIEHVPEAHEVFFHGPPAVFVMTCGTQSPQLNPDGCLIGRIAAEDGSLNSPRNAPDGDAPISYDWFLHPQCRM